ncbi:hypothetical protein QYM36_015347, partial [Artemia franciscana]
MAVEHELLKLENNAQSSNFRFSFLGGASIHVQWWKDNVTLLDDTLERSDNNYKLNELHIDSLSRYDDGMYLSCIAEATPGLPATSNAALFLSHKATIHISMYLETDRKLCPRYKTNRKRKKNAVTNDNMRHLETLIGNAKFLTRMLASSDRNVTISTLHLNTNKGHSGKKLTCRAENPAIKGAVIEDAITIEVAWSFPMDAGGFSYSILKYKIAKDGGKVHIDIPFFGMAYDTLCLSHRRRHPPSPSVMIGSALDIDFIIEGDDIFLECVVDANPPVEKLSWFRNGKRSSNDGGDNHFNMSVVPTTFFKTKEVMKTFTMMMILTMTRTKMWSRIKTVNRNADDMMISSSRGSTPN